jgi:hypothetical protein
LFLGRFNQFQPWLGSELGGEHEVEIEVFIEEEVKVGS